MQHLIQDHAWLRFQGMQITTLSHSYALSMKGALLLLQYKIGMHLMKSYSNSIINKKNEPEPNLALTLSLRFRFFSLPKPNLALNRGSIGPIGTQYTQTVLKWNSTHPIRTQYQNLGMELTDSI
jgi:hypothetical protein